jgi:hypothetical protein
MTQGGGRARAAFAPRKCATEGPVSRATKRDDGRRCTGRKVETPQFADVCFQLFEDTCRLRWLFGPLRA